MSRVAIALCCFALMVPVQGSAGTIVISQIYGGGGNSGATLQNDFIELFNTGLSPVDITGWSVQYASTTGSSWQKTVLAGQIAGGAYFLVQEAQGAGGTTPLPTPDATGSIPMSSTAGKVALVNNSVALTGTCPTGAAIVDFVGYGSTTDCFIGAGPTSTLSNQFGALRISNTGNNSADFVTGTPNPHNSAYNAAPEPGTSLFVLFGLAGVGLARKVSAAQ